MGFGGIRPELRAEKNFGLGLGRAGVGKTIAGEGQRVSIDAALHTSDKPYIQATGEAKISAKPDQAVIEIGLVSQAAKSLGGGEK